MLWQRARAAGEAADAAADGMPDALLLAAYAEDRLDAAERAEVEALLADDPVLAEDAAAARALAAAPPLASEAELARIIARASALVPDASAEGQVVPFRPRGGSRTGWAG